MDFLFKWVRGQGVPYVCALEGLVVEHNAGGLVVLTESGVLHYIHPSHVIEKDVPPEVFNPVQGSQNQLDDYLFYLKECGESFALGLYRVYRLITERGGKVEPMYDPDHINGFTVSWDGNKAYIFRPYEDTRAFYYSS